MKLEYRQELWKLVKIWPKGEGLFLFFGSLFVCYLTLSSFPPLYVGICSAATILFIIYAVGKVAYRLYTGQSDNTALNILFMFHSFSPLLIGFLHSQYVLYEAGEESIFVIIVGTFIGFIPMLMGFIMDPLREAVVAAEMCMGNFCAGEIPFIEYIIVAIFIHIMRKYPFLWMWAYNIAIKPSLEAGGGVIRRMLKDALDWIKKKGGKILKSINKALDTYERSL